MPFRPRVGLCTEYIVGPLARLIVRMLMHASLVVKETEQKIIVSKKEG